MDSGPPGEPLKKNPSSSRVRSKDKDINFKKIVLIVPVFLLVLLCGLLTTAYLMCEVQTVHHKEKESLEESELTTKDEVLPAEEVPPAEKAPRPREVPLPEPAPPPEQAQPPEAPEEPAPKEEAGKGQEKPKAEI